nr:MAG TPA: hypothetical protein [Caudoviricetes sp.]
MRAFAVGIPSRASAGRLKSRLEERPLGSC